MNIISFKRSFFLYSQLDCALLTATHTKLSEWNYQSQRGYDTHPNDPTKNRTDYYQPSLKVYQLIYVY